MESYRLASRLIVAILLLQTLLAPALCLAGLAADATETVICTAHGLQTVQFHEPGDGEPQGNQHNDFCPALASLSAMPAMPVPALPRPDWFVLAVSWSVTPVGLTAARARAPPFLPRGPPAAIS